MTRRDRERRPGRRDAFRDRKPLVLILCEGAVTERQYLEGLARACRNPRVTIEIAREHGLDPKTMVGLAKDRKKQAERKAEREGDKNLAFDAVWCIFDIDDHLKIPDARQMARDNGIDLAISNPCFELWLLLHFREPPGMHRRDVIQTMVKDHVPGYEKAVNFSLFADGCESAIRRARRLDEATRKVGEEGRNPSTGVHGLAVVIREEDPSTEPELPSG